MREERVAEGNRKFGRVYPIGKGDYTKEVNEDSKLDLVGEGMPGEGTGVVCYLFKDSLPDCKLLSPILAKVAALYPSTKFVSIVSDHCIENYPDKNCPTLLIYRKGDMMGQVVGLGGMGGQNVTVADVERILFAFRALDLHLKVTNTTVAQFSSRTPATKKAKDSDDDESDEDETFVGGGRQKSYGSKSGIRSSRRDEDEDDEYDL